MILNHIALVHEVLHLFHSDHQYHIHLKKYHFVPTVHFKKMTVQSGYDKVNFS